MTAVSPRARGLEVAALVLVVALAAALGRTAWDDAGGWAVVLFGVPLGCAGAAVAAERAGGPVLAPVLVAVCGVVSLAWSLLTGLGIGLVFALPSALLLAAAVVTRVDRTRDRVGPLRA